MTAGVIPRSDIKAVLKDTRLTLTIDQIQQIVFGSNLGDLVPLNFANDIAAASGGVAVGSLYHNAGVVRVRLT